MPSRRTVLTIVVAAMLAAPASAAASRIVYHCEPDLCVVNPETGTAQRLTADGAASPYRYPSVSRNGLKVAALRGNDVMVGDYGTNLTQRWAGERSINDVALSPDGTAVAESHSFVENRYGCPLTGGCLELVDRSATEVSVGDPTGTFNHRGGGGAGFLGAGALISSAYLIKDSQHVLCVVDAPTVADALCTVRVTAPAALSGPDGSADGRFIVATVGGEPSAVVLFDAAAGTAIRELAKGSQPSFSPDGTQVAFAGHDGWVYTVPTAGGTPRKLVQGLSPSWGEGAAPGPALASTKLRQRKGKLPVKVECVGTETCQGKLTIKKGKGTLGKRNYRVAAGKSATVKITPTSRGKRTIARSRSHKVTVELKPKTGSTIKTKLTLRRA
jgi:hypothetical protein